MNLNWSNRVIKYVLFVFNLLFVISGIIMIAVGVSVKSYYSDYDIFLNDSYFSLPNLLIATGSLIFFISFFGCCGAIRESWFMIFIFSVLLSVIFILEFSAGIAGYVLRDKTTGVLTDNLKQSMKEYKFDPKNTNGVTSMWDTMQRNFECCGAEGPLDWRTVPRPVTTKAEPVSTKPTEITISSSTESTPATEASSGPSTTETSTVTESTSSKDTGRKRRAADGGNNTPDNDDLPASCCKSKDGASGYIYCHINATDTAVYYNQGCVSGLGTFLKDHAVTLGGVGMAIAFIQLFGVIFACHLTKQLKHGFYST